MKPEYSDKTTDLHQVIESGVRVTLSFLCSILWTIICLFDIFRFGGVRVTRSLVVCVCFVDRCLSFCTFSFWSLYRLFSVGLPILTTTLVSSHFDISEGHNSYRKLRKSSTSTFGIDKLDDTRFYRIHLAWVKV